MSALKKPRGLPYFLVLVALACGGGSTASLPPSDVQPSAKASRVVVITHTAGFRHDSIPIAETTIEQLGRDSGLFEVAFCRTAEDVQRMLTPAALSDVAGVIFANTTGNIGIPDLDGFLAWVASGRGVVGVHSASDTYHDRPAFLEMLGNEFDTHGKQTEVEAVVEAPGHPAVSHLGTRYKVFDEIYRFVRNNRGNVTPLLTLDRYPADGLASAGQPGDLPLAWAKTHGSGRVFYTALGHRIELWRDAQYQQHVLGGIRAALNR